MRVLAFLLLLAAPASAEREKERTVPLAKSHPVRRLIERFRLFPSLAAALPGAERDEARRRAFHEEGDPDELFTLGDLGRSGPLSFKAALEVNDVVLRSLAPDARVEPTDTRPRAAGDYRALDASGRPYQLRLGARLLW